MIGGIIEILRWFPEAFDKPVERSWTQRLGRLPKGETSDSLYFIRFDTEIGPDLVLEARNKTAQLAVAGVCIFPDSRVSIKFEGREMGVLTRENWLYHGDGTVEDLRAQTEWYRPTIGTYDQEGRYFSVMVDFGPIKGQRNRFIRLVEESEGLVR